MGQRSIARAELGGAYHHPMRIALNAQKLSFAQAYHAAGISRYIYHLLHELRELPSAHSFEAFAPLPPPGCLLSSTSRFRVRPTGAQTESPLVRVLWEQLILPTRTRGRFDLLHGTAFALPVFWSGPSVVTMLDLSFLRHPRMFKRSNRLYLTFSCRLAARRADRILTIAEHGRREVIELLGVAPSRVTTTYCAADDRFRPLPTAEVEAFRASRQLPSRFILYLGTLEPRKNVVTLIRAYARLRSEWPAAPDLILAGGTGWMYGEVYATLRRLGLAEHIRCAGFVPDSEQPLWYNAAAVFAYPSLYEGFGLPPLEAMACGTPVVVSDCTSLPEVVGPAGLLVPPADERSLASSLKRVLEDDALARTMRQAGLERAAQFSWRRMAVETLRCYDEVESSR
jgi:glycosyltransferase involved in cell wall biosynthesis